MIEIFGQASVRRAASIFADQASMRLPSTNRPLPRISGHFIVGVPSGSEITPCPRKAGPLPVVALASALSPHPARRDTRRSRSQKSQIPAAQCRSARNRRHQESVCPRQSQPSNRASGSDRGCRPSSRYIGLHDTPQPRLAVGMSRADALEPIRHFLKIPFFDRQQQKITKLQESYQDSSVL